MRTAMQQRGRQSGAAAIPALQDVEFLTIALAALADGTIHVSATATTVDDQEPQLLSQEITAGRVETVNEALVLIGRIVRASA